MSTEKPSFDQAFAKIATPLDEELTRNLFAMIHSRHGSAITIQSKPSLLLRLPGVFPRAISKVN
jgi:hypothetical protein